MSESEQVAMDLAHQLNAAQSELAALREELERANSRYDRDVLGLNNEGDPISGDPAGGYKADNERLQQRLTAAEQRNADLTTILTVASLTIPHWRVDAKDSARELVRRIDAALKPTESGASE